MKKLIIIRLLAIIILCSILPAPVTAVNNTLYTVCMQKKLKDKVCIKKKLKDKKDQDNEGRRIPPVPVSCDISRKGEVKNKC